MRRVSDKWLIWLALLAVYVIWGSTYLGIRVTLESFPPFLMAGVRFTIAGTLLYGGLRLRGHPAPRGREWRGAAVIGTLLLVGGNGGVVVAEQWVASGLAALGVATVPLWAALFAGLWGRWPGRRDWLSLGIGFVGVALLNLEGDMRANPVGALALMFAAISWAFGTVLSRRMALPQGMMASGAEMLVAGLVFLLISVARGEQMSGPPSLRSLAALIYLIIFGGLVAFSAYTFLLPRVRPALATSYAYVNPLVAVALGMALAGERLTRYGVVAMLVILASVALLALGRERAAPPPAARGPAREQSSSGVRL